LNNSTYDIVIIGGGFCGSMLAVHLLRRNPNLSVALVDKSPLPGRGVAYGTKHACHLLNVPSNGMSAFPDQPDHFLRWARVNYEPFAQPSDFLPRAVYGRYIASLLETAAKNSPNFHWIQGEVSSVTPEPSRIPPRIASQVNVQLADGTTLLAQTLVLAVGNFPPANIKVPGLSDRCARYASYPWSPAALKDIPQNGSVLLIGSGLTSVDVAIALHSDGFAGHIHMLSRRGLLPQPHGPKHAWPQFWNERSPRTIRGLLRLVRAELRAAADANYDWRSVVDALRPVTQQIWQSLPHDEQKRFLRHLRPYWEANRHRMASHIGEAISALFRDGKATLYAGRITQYRELSDCAEISFRERRTHTERVLRVDRVINCAGPETDYRRMDAPLIKSVLAQRLARPDALFLGLDVDANGALIDSNGEPSPSLYAIGPARKGLLWETTAVPELREQASQLAAHITRWLSSVSEEDNTEAATNTQPRRPSESLHMAME
jgi:uncharacterized NAD(P)/FAD-binding protein YdhS